MILSIVRIKSVRLQSVHSKNAQKLTYESKDHDFQMKKAIHESEL